MLQLLEQVLQVAQEPMSLQLLDVHLNLIMRLTLLMPVQRALDILPVVRAERLMA
jgi:hypothetical protein